MSTIDASIQIARSPADVFRFVADPENGPRWRADVTQVRLVGGEGVSIGAQYELVVTAMGQSMSSVAEVTELEPDRSIRMRATKPMKMEVEYHVSPTSDGSDFAIRIDAGIMGKMMAPMVRPSLERDLKQLKELLEAE